MTTPSPSLESFVDQLLAEKGMSGLDADVLAEAREDLMSRVEDRINAGILAHMPEEQFPAFDEVLAGGKSEEIQAFCKKHVSDLDTIVAGELLSFRQTYIGG